MTQTLAPDTPPTSMQTTDPRVLRSRRRLMDALAQLLIERSLEDISVQDIADAAGLNRATFYLHYPDKNSLLQALAAGRFRDLVERRGLTFGNCDGALKAIALGVCDYLAETPGCPGQLAKMPIESAIIPVVEDMIRVGAASHGHLSAADADLLASAAAWGIFGAARRWLATPDRIAAEAMADKIEALMKPILLAASAQG